MTVVSKPVNHSSAVGGIQKKKKKRKRPARKKVAEQQKVGDEEKAVKQDSVNETQSGLHQEGNKVPSKSVKINKETLEELLQKSPSEIRYFLLNPDNNMKAVFESKSLEKVIIFLIRVLADALQPTNTDALVDDVKKMLLKSNLFTTQFRLVIDKCPDKVLPALLNDTGLLFVTNGVISALPDVSARRRRGYIRFCNYLGELRAKHFKKNDELSVVIAEKIDDICNVVEWVALNIDAASEKKKDLVDINNCESDLLMTEITDHFASLSLTVTEDQKNDEKELAGEKDRAMDMHQDAGEQNLLIDVQTELRNSPSEIQVVANKKDNFEMLEQLLTKPPSEIRSLLMNPSKKMKKCFKSNLDQEILLLIKLFAIALQPTNNVESLDKIKQNFLGTNLFKGQLPELIAKDPAKALKLLKRTELLRVMNAVISALPSVPSENRSHFVKFCKQLSKLKKVLPYARKTGVVAKIDHIIQKVEKSQTLMSQNKKKQPKKKKKNFHMKRPKDLQDFRDMTIIPTDVELLSGKKAYLRKNIIQGSYSNIHHYLEIHFRLMREDLVWPMRRAVREYRKNHTTVNLARFGDVPFYRDVDIFKDRNNFYLVAFSTAKKSNWDRTEKFKSGTLLCMSNDGFQTIHFGVVKIYEDDDDLPVNETVIQIEDKKANRRFQVELECNNTFIVFESPAFFESYCHVLHIFQTMTPGELPLEDQIVRVKKEKTPPVYLKKTNSTYSLPVSEAVNCDVPVLDFDKWPSASELGLDISQMKALQHALSSSLALIQGPPGTGKTYIGLKIIQALLNNKHKWPAKYQVPILIVCFTNHALDQFLEGVLEFNQNLVRVGRQSVSEKLEEFNLTHLRDCHIENLHRLRNEIEGLKTEIEKYTSFLTSTKTRVFHECMFTLSEPDSSILKGFLDIRDNFESKSSLYAWLGITFDKMTTDPKLLEFFDCYKGFSRPKYIPFDTSEGIEAKQLDQVETHFNKCSRKFKKTQDYKDLEKAAILRRELAVKELKKTNVMSETEVENIDDVWKLSIEDRWRLYRRWMSFVDTGVEKAVCNLENQIKEKMQILERTPRDFTYSILKDADIIGMTTTGASRNHPVLNKIGCRIVLVEEAAEVFESHIIASLNRKTCHLILIGDHQQLRPLPAVNHLKNCEINVSLFERLMKNGLPHVTLEQQHRMRPEISALARSQFYPSLRDHPSVTRYPPIRGIRDNVYYFNHSAPESVAKLERPTFKNDFEADFIVSLYRYLLQQGYSDDQISILVTYNGQLAAVEKRLCAQSLYTENLRVSTVDNFQGEESDIILISLVRSNSTGSIGFLSESNRITVALTRAKQGLYVLGNFNHLAQNSKLWKKIVDESKSKHILGTSFPIVCQFHPDHVRYMKESKTFASSAPNGLCKRQCGCVMQCGHFCKKKCHLGNHACNLNEKLVRLPCGHKTARPCDNDLKNYLCRESVTYLFQNCGHAITVECQVKLQVNICPRCAPYYMYPCDD